MASEQENRIVAEVMDNMKMAETEESAARRYVRRAVDKILIYCCREDLPERLEGTAAQIAEDKMCIRDRGIRLLGGGITDEMVDLDG